jgi:hypothetical protein
MVQKVSLALVEPSKQACCTSGEQSGAISAILVQIVTDRRAPDEITPAKSELAKRAYNVSCVKRKKGIPLRIHIAFMVGLGLVSGQNSFRGVS